MSDLVKLVQGDFGHKLSVTLLDDASGAALNVSGATVRLFFRKSDGTSLTATVVATFPAGGADGKVEFTWPAGALAAVGRYDGEVEIDTGTKKQTVYDLIKFNVRAQKEV
jgi:hypothetical protein